MDFCFSYPFQFLFPKTWCFKLFSQFNAKTPQRLYSKGTLIPLTHIICDFVLSCILAVPPPLTYAEPQESSSNICLHSQWKQHLPRAWCHDGMWGIFQARCQSGGPGPLAWGILGREWWSPREPWHAGYVLNGQAAELMQSQQLYRARLNYTVWRMFAKCVCVLVRVVVRGLGQGSTDEDILCVKKYNSFSFLMLHSYCLNIYSLRKF